MVGLSFHTDPDKVWLPKLEPIHKIIANPRIATIHHRTVRGAVSLRPSGALVPKRSLWSPKVIYFQLNQYWYRKRKSTSKRFIYTFFDIYNMYSKDSTRFAKKIYHHHQLDDLTWPTGLGPSLKPPGFEIRSSRHCCLRGTIQGLGESGAKFCLGGNRWFLWWRCVCVCFTRDFLYLSKVYLSKHSKFRNCPLGPKRLSLTVWIDDGNLDLSSAYAPWN